MEKKFLTYVSNGNIKKTHEMLENGINPNLNYKGRIPLVVACRRENIDMLKLLIDKGADPNMSDDIGTTALNISSSHGYIKSVKYLLEVGANPNISDDCGYSPLINSSLNYNDDIIEILINAGADINSINNRHETALMTAIIYNRLEIVKKLIKHGAKPFIKNNFGKNARYIAKRFGNKQMIKTIEEYMILFKMTRRCQKFLKYKKNKKILAYKNLALSKLFEIYDVDEPLCKHMRKTNIVSVYG